MLKRTRIEFIFFLSLTIVLGSGINLKTNAKVESKTYFYNDSLDGAQLFRKYCSMCHGIDYEIVGPALGNITQERNVRWLIKFIHNGSKMVKEKDKDAVKLYEKYMMVEHPDFTYLSKKQIKSILQYLRKSK